MRRVLCSMLALAAVGHALGDEFEASQRCVLALCRLWHVRRVQIIAPRVAQTQQRGITNMMLAAGVRVSEEDMDNINTSSFTRFTNVMSYSHTAHVLLYPDEDFLAQTLVRGGSSVTWLLVLRPCEEKNVTHVLETLLVKVLHHVISVTVIVESSPPRTFQVSRVSADQSLALRPLALCEGSRRLARLQQLKAPTSLHGVTLTAVYAKPARDDSPDQWTQAYLVLWRFLAESLNFTLKVRQSEARLPEAGWGALLGEVQAGGAHISLAPIPMLPSTALNITFSTPVHRTSLSVLVRGSASDRVRWNSFFQPFERPLWSALLTSVSLLSLVLAVLWRAEYKDPDTTQRPQQTTPPPPRRLPDLLSECVLCVLGAACMQGHPFPPQSTSARCVHLTALVSAVVMVAVYSSSVTAFLAVTRDDRPFASLSQLLTNSRFRPITLAGSPENVIFEESGYPALVQHRAVAAPSTLASLSVALTVACGHNTSLLGPWSRRVPALVLSSLWVDRALAVAPCKLVHFSLADATSQHLWAAFPLALNLPYSRLINQRLHRMHEAGSILRFSDLIALRAGLARAQEEHADAQAPRFTVALRDIAPLLALLGCGTALAVSLLAAELVVRHCIDTKTKSGPQVHPVNMMPTTLYSYYD